MEENMNKKALLLTVLLSISFIVSGCGSSSEQVATMTAAVWIDTPTSTLTVTSTAVQPGLLQFKAGGHVLGFSAGGFTAATGSHALHVDFIDSRNVQPQAQVPGGGHAVPLEAVFYPNLWPGVSLLYDVPPGGILRSTYQLEPGADVGAIRLRYNAHLAVNQDGSLIINFDTGMLTESAPLAWQVIDGKQAAVGVRYTLHNEQAGFALQSYDARYPLTIDPTLSWHSFLGDSYSDEGGNLALDRYGNIYVGGSSMTAWSCTPVSCRPRP